MVQSNDPMVREIKEAQLKERKEKSDVVLEGLRQYMDENKLSQRQVAKEVGVDHSVLSKWFRGTHWVSPAFQQVLRLKNIVK